MNKNNFFSELTRVQMPAMVHLTKLGYKYYGKMTKDHENIEYDPDTNILIKVFKKKIKELNPSYTGNIEQILKDIKQELDYDDLGKSFYKRLTSITPYKLIDFENPSNNEYHCTAEFTCERDGENFRPDITLFINGLPIAFVEVKKPNNHGGMLEEANRMNNIRFPQRKFRRFINITQLMIFSNNMEYDAEGGIVPIQGAFYCTGAKEKAKFNCFREDVVVNGLPKYVIEYPYLEVDAEVEKQILSDFNCQVIHTTPEYQKNLNINTPTNRILTSMCSKERLLFLIKYGISYVNSEKEVDGRIEKRDEKHIMRYQQLFASLEVRRKIDEGAKGGVIWHTQGSGKTALSYNLVNVLTDYYAKKNTVAKFYFIVDRIDLLEQATGEFEARGLEVKTANSREELMKQFRNNQSLEGNSGNREITVVNIQRFEEDHEKVEISDYATNLQRIFIIDEAHRGYNPKGSFLANLLDADRNSIKIALTGTPLLAEERSSWKVFGKYFHTYYYDKSIKDGYTLKIIREDIETQYKNRLSEIYENLENLINKDEIKKYMIVEHEAYISELLRYIINDFKMFRKIQDDESLGGMIICETGTQAKKLYEMFNTIQDELNEKDDIKSDFKVGLILHDVDDKEIRKNIIKDFKKNMTVDILIVYNMLLTGFDAPRLKRLYLGRKLKDHSLLQAITRVNRTYKDMKYGYLVDFADIKQNFKETNDAYLEELQKYNDPEQTGEGYNVDIFNQVIEDKDTIMKAMQDIRQVLFNYTTNNLEEFSDEISSIDDKAKLVELRKALVSARDYCNIVRVFGDEKLKEEFKLVEISNLSSMISEVQRHIDNINLKEAFSTDDKNKQIINEAMLSISFKFQNVGKEEMDMSYQSNDIQDKWNKTIVEFTECIDPEDEEFVSIKEAFMNKFKEYGFVISTTEQFEKTSKELDEVLKKLEELQRKNKALLNKYNGDAKFVRIHKRIREENRIRKERKEETIISEYDENILNVLSKVKNEIDQKVYDRNDILKRDAYFEQTVMNLVSVAIDEIGLKSTRDDRIFLQRRIAKQYLDQYNETYNN